RFATLSANRRPEQVQQTQLPTSLNHVVGSLLKNPRYVEAKRLRGLEVDDQFVLDRRLNWQLGRFLALEDAIGIGRAERKIIELVNSVGQQAADFSEDSARIDGRETIASCKRCDFCTMEVREGIGHHDQSAIRLAGLSGNDRLDFRPVANRGCDRLYCE